MHRWIERLAHFMALLGGFALSLLILLTCVSVGGRVLNSFLHGWIGQTLPGFAQSMLDWGIGPVKGDLEIVEAGVAFAIFAFLPLCQLTREHADVDVFATKLPDSVNRVLRMIIDIVFAAVLALIAVQLSGGMLTKLREGDETFILGFPVWWGYAASLVAATAASIVGLYVAFTSTRDCLNGQDPAS